MSSSRAAEELLVQCVLFKDVVSGPITYEAGGEIRIHSCSPDLTGHSKLFRLGMWRGLQNPLTQGTKLERDRAHGRI